MAKGKGDEVCEIENMPLPHAPYKVWAKRAWRYRNAGERADALERLGSQMPVAGMRAAQQEEGTGNWRNGWRISVVAPEEVALDPFHFLEAGMTVFLPLVFVIVSYEGKHRIQFGQNNIMGKLLMTCMTCGHACVMTPCVPHGHIARPCADSFASPMLVIAYGFWARLWHKLVFHSDLLKVSRFMKVPTRP
ncbi:hypothetical protein GOBAR_AA17682 [Gossypium barbadense]|uniref:Uncharacterized protein n=1 Tax=Gossypium barbadense TaxID=3634 RepID=A0A2P5XI41_GOSBA|nr:hypothetical protein GOBAR_AA17682 [Gossypium barbadense]